MSIDNRRAFHRNGRFFVSGQVGDRWLVETGSSIDIYCVDDIL